MTSKLCYPYEAPKPKAKKKITKEKIKLGKPDLMPKIDL
jgi:hypothetical protein